MPHLTILIQTEIDKVGWQNVAAIAYAVVSALPEALLCGVVSFTPSLDSDFTFALLAGWKECFYQPMPLKASLEMEYQVLHGGELDIDFHLSSPEGRTLVF